MAFLQIEETVEAIFEELYPRHAAGARAIKPLLAPALGCAVIDPDVRQLLPNRDYQQLDMLDFLDYATSDLASLPHLRDFTRNEISFYQGFDHSPGEPMMLATEMGIGLSILSAAVARTEVFVSVTMQFMVYGDGFTESQLVTMTFAPSKSEFPNGERALLEEWDRYSIFPPTPGDNDWRFVMSGIYTDHLLEEMARQPMVEGAATGEQIAAIRSQASANKTKFSTFFELARLGLHLPPTLISCTTSLLTRKHKSGQKGASSHQPRHRSRVANQQTQVTRSSRASGSFGSIALPVMIVHGPRRRTNSQYADIGDTIRTRLSSVALRKVNASKGEPGSVPT